MRWTLRIFLVYAILVAVGLECAKANVIFTNLGPGDSFDLFAYGFGRVPAEDQRAYAGSAFTSSGSFHLDNFTMALQFTLLTGNPPLPQPLDILLMSNSSAGLPGSIIESFHETIDASSPGNLVTIDSLLHPTLAAGEQYWVVATAGSIISPMISGGWILISIGDTVPRAVVQGTDLNDLMFVGGARPAFRVEGTAVSAVPEPSSLALLGIGFLVLAIVGVRK
jgi:PEP-CTERM motif